MSKFTKLSVAFALVLFLLGILLLLYKTLIQNEIKNRENNTAVQTEKPIACPDNKSIKDELQKRDLANKQPVISEKYIGVYNNKWTYKMEKGEFNILQKDEEAPYRFKARKYPVKEKTVTQTLISTPSLIENFLEEIRYEPFNISIYGSGYIFSKNSVIRIVSNAIFNENREDCFDSGRRNISLMIDNPNKDLDYAVNHSSSSRLTFKRFTPDYCSAYSFLETSGDIFLICLSEKLSQNTNRFLVLGYTYVKDSKLPNKSKFLPIMLNHIEEPARNSYYKNTFSNYFNMVQATSNEYLLISKTKIYLISVNNSGYLNITNTYSPPSITNDSLSLTSYNNNLPNLDYLILSTSANGAIFNTINKEFVKIDENSCIVNSPEGFYNRTIDPFFDGPYKNLKYNSASKSQYQITQTVAVSGCVTEEGIINISLDPNLVTCEITVSGKRSCY